MLVWEISNTINARICVRAMQQTISQYETSEIVNANRDCPFTLVEFTQPLQAVDIKLPMDGKGRCLDNVFVGRLWRTVNYEEVYLESYYSLVDAHAQLNWAPFVGQRGMASINPTR